MADLPYESDGSVDALFIQNAQPAINPPAEPEQAQQLQEMARYHQADFEDAESNNSVQLDNASSTQVRIRQGRTFWRTRSLLERSLLLICGSLLLVIFILFIIMGTKQGWEDKSNFHVATNSDDGIHCLSRHCVTVAASMIDSINHDANPCEDFYEYACGGWVKKNTIPYGKSSWGTFGKLEQDNQLVIKAVLEKPLKELKSKSEQKAKIYYESCIDANETIESLGAQPLLDLLESVGGWNISGDFDINTFDLQEKLQVLQNGYNMGGLFAWSVSEDDKNSSINVISIDQGGLVLPAVDIYLNKTRNARILTSYLEYMTKIGVLLGGEENETRRQMKEVLEFETRIAEITTPQDQRRDEEQLYHPMTIANLQKIAPFISWLDYFQNATNIIDKKINSKLRIINFDPNYFKRLNNLMTEYKKTDDKKNIINNYLVWQTVRSLVAYLSRPFRDAYKDLRKALAGMEGREEQWRYCITDTNGAMGFAVGAMFVREVFHGKSKPKAEAMINEIRKAFVKNLINIDWMDNETRKAAEEKANAITDMIGFPNFILNPNELDEKYNDVIVKNNEYFMNNIRLSKFNLKKCLEKLDQPVNKSSWIMTPPAVNAYYTPSKNQIVFPAGILQRPFFDLEYPSSLNFGGMGVVMGHELTHGFDDQGREYDLHGNLHQWWNNATIEKFKNRTECIVEQYSNYEWDGRRVNGRQTLGENIADNGGLKAAYHAYLASVKERNDERLLPGLQLNHRQLFFVNFAQVWCSTITPEAARMSMQKDAHCPPKYRVIGPLSNLPEFANEFNCAKGTRMNPEESCTLW